METSQPKRPPVSYKWLEQRILCADAFRNIDLGGCGRKEDNQHSSKRKPRRSERTPSHGKVTWMGEDGRDQGADARRWEQSVNQSAPTDLPQTITIPAWGRPTYSAPPTRLSAHHSVLQPSHSILQPSLIISTVRNRTHGRRRPEREGRMEEVTKTRRTLPGRTGQR